MVCKVSCPDWEHQLHWKLVMHILMSHTSFPKSEILSFNKPQSDSDACSSVITTGLTPTRLIINDFLLYERWLCLYRSKSNFEQSQKCFKNDMSNEHIEDCVMEFSLQYKCQTRVIRGEMEERNKITMETPWNHGRNLFVKGNKISMTFDFSFSLV